LAVWPALALPVTTCRREQALKALKFGPDSGVAQLSAWQLWLSLKLDGGRVEICPSWGGGGPNPPPPHPPSHPWLGPSLPAGPAKRSLRLGGSGSGSGKPSSSKRREGAG
jgi:hypothetical protein